MDLKPGDIYYAPLPLFHIAGQWAMCYSSMIAGSAAVVTERFSVERFWSDARRFGATVTFFLGAMANFLARQPRKPDDGDVPSNANSSSRCFRMPAALRADSNEIKTTTGHGSVRPHRMDWKIPMEDRAGWRRILRGADFDATTRGRTALLRVRHSPARNPGSSCRYWRHRMDGESLVQPVAALGDA